LPKGRSIEFRAVPARAGIDPFHLLLDRNPDDNVVKVEIGARSPAR